MFSSSMYLHLFTLCIARSYSLVRNWQPSISPIFSIIVLLMYLILIIIFNPFFTSRQCILISFVNFTSSQIRLVHNIYQSSVTIFILRLTHNKCFPDHYVSQPATLYIISLLPIDWLCPNLSSFSITIQLFDLSFYIVMLIRTL